MNTRPRLTLVPTTVQAPGQARMAEHDLVELMRSHRDPLLRYVLRLTFGDQYLAEDITQETLVRAWHRAGKAELRPDSVRPWLFTVARRLVVDGFRARSARPTEVYGEFVEQQPATGDDIERVLLAHDLDNALARLTERHRQVLVEVYLRGLSLAEVATKHGIPLGTVRSRVHHALRAIRPHLNATASTTEHTMRSKIAA
jgi:RNA polymerase sigma-70 factor (ECF subfamily)